MRRTRLYRNLLCALAACALSVSAHARSDAESGGQPQGSSGYAISASVIAAGGVTRATSACYELAGTSGQPVVGVTQGGTYQLRAGYWGNAVFADSLFRSSFEDCQP